MTALEQVRTCVAAASQAANFELRVTMVAAARVTLNKHRLEVDVAESLVVAHETELLRLKAPMLEATK